MKRGSELQDVSCLMGLSYAERIDRLPEHIIDNDFLLFTSFNLHKKKMLATCFRNILAGELENFEIFLSDFRSDYTVDAQAFGYEQTVAVLRSDAFSFRKFCLTPRRAERFTVRLEHMGQDFVLPIIRGYKKIRFSGHPQLNSMYILKAKAGDPSQDFFNMGFLEYLEGHPGWFVEGSSDCLLVYCRGERIKPSDIRKYVDDVLQVGKRLLVEKG